MGNLSSVRSLGITLDCIYYFNPSSQQFPWCSGYHICLTHRRSPVRSRAETLIPRGLTARISGFHPGGPGSTPGVGILLTFLFVRKYRKMLKVNYTYNNGANLQYVQTVLNLKSLSDEVAEWLRRWTANPMGSARVGSNPIFVEIFFLPAIDFLKM